MIKKFITLFFLLLFVIQILPIKQVGRLIAGSTMTEELPETTASKSLADILDSKWVPLPFTIQSGHWQGNISQVSHLHFSETLPVDFGNDVHTPPPDIFC